MSKGKRFSLYLLFTILVLIFLYLGFRYEINLRIQTGKTYSSPAQYYFYSALFPILVGIILALPGLIREFRKIGKWSMDWIKLLAIGVPTLLLNLNLILIAFTPIGKIEYFTTFNPFIEVMITDESVISLCGAIFGYILISSFSKRD
ncbi:hypothetical protein [Desulfitobacterium sp.]|uniref:hypothetical protein n=1 Tax=Desulfitobacterium sp. TaxID=49981 RepID=UPI002B20EBA2|nr:hypothetical protein [Desulfitobacterium sp.]MEA4902525.1 hypothetical protein [Desulfitobacterium sp.]